MTETKWNYNSRSELPNWNSKFGCIMFLYEKWSTVVYDCWKVGQPILAFLPLQYVRKQFISNTELEKQSAAYFLNFDTFATFRKLYLFISLSMGSKIEDHIID